MNFGIAAGVLMVWAAMAGLGGWVATQKHRESWEGVLLGAIFGPFGVLIEGILPVGSVPPPSGSLVSAVKNFLASERALAEKVPAEEV